jgi:hypothetical protein
MANKVSYYTVDMSDVISLVGREQYDIFIKWLKDNLDYAEKQPQGGGDFHFTLNGWEDEEAEICNESPYEGDECPLEIIKIINKIHYSVYKGQEPVDNLKYVMNGWQ